MLSLIAIGCMVILGFKAGPASQTAATQSPFKTAVAVTPPMGWNSLNVKHKPEEL
jgi:uncharacterized membrane protein YbjE (DUF340 family)